MGKEGLNGVKRVSMGLRGSQWGKERLNGVKRVSMG